MKKLDPKTDGASPDIVRRNIEKLRTLFPDAFTEGSDGAGPRWKVDLDKLKEIIGDYTEERSERYSFTWNGKDRARRIAQTPSTGTLRPCPEESVNWESTQNLFIEGDNLEVLKLLQKSYHRKVKLIYIDPPYNTGNDFIYPDKFDENLDTYLRYTGQKDSEGFKMSANLETSGRFHTNWLNMMYPRLKLARNLLRDDGVIFISIDDNEIASLRKLCDEIFGEENFIGIIVWHRKTQPSYLSKDLIKVTEYIMVYKKTVIEIKFKGGYTVEGKLTELLNISNHRSKRVLPKDNVIIAGDYTGILESGLYGNDELKVELHNTVEVIEGLATNNLVMTGRFKWTQNRINEEVESGGQIFIKTLKTLRPTILKGDSGSKIKPPITILSKYINKMPTNTDANSEMKKMFEKPLLDYPKPVKLVEYLVDTITYDENKALVLDFFAGSATAAHAVIDLNKQDGGNRKFIMVQLPEPCDENSAAFEAGYRTIADIGKERIRRVIKKITDEQVKATAESKVDFSEKKQDAQLLDLGFKVFKLDASNIRPWEADFDNLDAALFDSVENIKPDRSEQDVLYELLLKYGLDLAVPIEERKIATQSVYIIGSGALVVCLGMKVGLEVVEGIASLREELKPEVMRVVFRDAGFNDDVVKTNAVQILRQAGIEDVKSL